MADFRINGVMHDFASIELTTTVVGYSPLISEISYKSTLNRTKVYGTRRKAVGRTGGNLEEEGSITFYRQGFDDMIAKLGEGFGLVEWNALLVFRTRGSSIYVRDELIGCTLGEVDVSLSQGDDPNVVKCALSIMRIKYNGRQMVDDEIG